jgi:predicted lactoylglutathione lyase
MHMASEMFVNLPVKDLRRSVNFFTKLGYAFDPKFTDDNATCMIVSDKSYVMLLAEDFFKSFTSKSIADATRTAEVMVALSMPSRSEVDRIVKAAIAAGATASRDPKDHGFMYEWGFQDLDGHIWDYFHMDDDPPRSN